MIKKVKIEEIRRFQKIAGLLKEEDLDLSATPRFNQEPNLSDKDFLNFVWDSIHDWIEHKFGTIDPASRRGAVEQFLNSVPDSDLRDYWDDYIERKRRGIEENDIDLSDTPEFRGMPSATELIDAFNNFDNEVNIGATYRKPAYRTLKHVTDDNSAPEEAAFGEESFSLFNLNSRNYVIGYKDYIYKGMRFRGGVTIGDFLSNFLEKGIIFELGGAYWYYKYDLSLFLKELKSWCNRFCDKEFTLKYNSQDQDYYFVEGKNDIDLSDTPEFFSEPDMWDESFRSFVWDIVGDHYEELYGTIDLDDIDDIIGQYLMNLPYDKLKALWGDYTKHKRTGLKESNIDLSNTPEFTDEKKQFYVYDIEGMEAPFGPFTQEKAYKVMKKLKNDSGEDYGVVNGKVAREIWGLQEDIDLSDIPKFNEGSFKAVFRPLLRREGIQDDRYYNLVLHGYMENELLKKVKGKDIPEVYEKIVTDYDWVGRGNVQHLEDAIENLGIEEGFPEGCLEPSPSGGIVSLLVSEDTVLDIVEAPLKENDIDLSDTPKFTGLNKSKIQREFEKAGVNVKRPIFVYSTYRLFGDYGMAKRSVGEYIDEILNTIGDLESDPDYGDSYGDVELKIVSNPDDVDPFDYFVEDDPKDIKLKVLIEGAVHDLIFQK